MSFYYIQLGCALLVFRLRNDIHNTIKSYAHLAWPGGGTCFRIGKWFWGHTRIHALQSFIGVSCLFHKYVNIYFTESEYINKIKEIIDLEISTPVASIYSV